MYVDGTDVISQPVIDELHEGLSVRAGLRSSEQYTTGWRDVSLVRASRTGRGLAELHVAQAATHVCKPFANLAEVDIRTVQELLGRKIVTLTVS